VVKPKLLFFQWDHNYNVGYSNYLLTHVQDHACCLSQFFDVTVISHDCDFEVACDVYEPDLVIFESGHQSSHSRRPKIRNTHKNSSVLRLGLHNADAWSHRRSGFLSDMAEWQVEDFFSIALTTAEYMPAIKDRLFVWPNFVDGSLFRNYAEKKQIPVLITGQASSLYPWRSSVFPIVERLYPCLRLPTFHYDSALAHRTVSGERYARFINSSFLVPACGSVAKEVVRKHFEIPAAYSCLVTEESQGLIAAGFKDMENCVFANPSEVVDRIDFLLNNPDILSKLTENGHRLVHSRHTMAQRDQIFRWYTLRQHLRPGEKIVQRNPFEPLQIMASSEPSTHVGGHGVERRLLSRGRDLFWAGKIEQARSQFAQCLGYADNIPEPRFYLALCDLAEGDPEGGVARLSELIQETLCQYGAKEPDPVEWAYFLLAMICCGKMQRVSALLKMYPELHHIEIHRIKRLLGRLDLAQIDLGGGVEARASIHFVPVANDEEWTKWVLVLLRRCGQSELQMALERGGSLASSAPKSRQSPPFGYAYSLLHLALVKLRLTELFPNVPPAPEFRFGHHLVASLRRPVMRSRPLRHLRRAMYSRREMREIQETRRNLE
jgi:hypothetical protein